MKHLALLISLLLPTLGAAEPLKVVTTLPTFAAITAAIAGERAEVSAIVPPQFNPHFIEPRPSDVLRVKRCDLFIHTGLDLEVWREPLVNRSGNLRVRPGGDRVLDLSSTGVRLLEIPIRPLSRAEGDIHLHGNPHYWHDPENGLIMARAIAGKLAAIDPDHAGEYEAALARFERALRSAMARWQDELRPSAGRALIGYHNEWAYLMKFLGLRMEQFIEPKPGIPPSPRHLEMLMSYIRSERIPATVQASFYPTDAAEKLGEHTGLRLAVLCQNVGELPACTDYLSMFEHNVSTLREAMTPSA